MVDFTLNLRTPERFPFGSRGERPVFFACDEAAQELITWVTPIPGAIRAAGGVRCTLDAAPEVAAALSTSFTQLDPTPRDLALPGFAEYKKLGLHEKRRQHQIEAFRFLACRAYGILADPPRAGKTLSSLIGSVLVGAQRVLIVCPAIAKLVWASEAAKWLGASGLCLEGRSGKQGRLWCITCQGRGYVLLEEPKLLDDPKAKPKRRRCPDCTSREKRSGTGQFYGGLKLLGDAQSRGGAEALQDAIQNSRFTIVNYDLLLPQKKKDEFGKSFYDYENLPGWVPTISANKYDLVIADECHGLRGWTPKDPESEQMSKREKFIEAAGKSPRAWGLTGTPYCGFNRDYWGQLDTLSNGLYGRGKPFEWDLYFCGGGQGEYGWQRQGSTHETELKERLRLLTLSRPRSVICKDMPPKTRQVQWIEEDEGEGPEVKLTARSKERAFGALFKKTLGAKLPHAVPTILDELTTKAKIVIYVYNVESVAKVVKEFERAYDGNAYGPRLKAVDLKIFACTGSESQDARFNMARSYREHDGACLFVATIDSMQVAVSLFGTHYVHYFDLHHGAHALLQSEDRGYEPGLTHGLVIVYWVLRGSSDERVISVLLPKVERLDRIANTEGASSLQKALYDDKQASVDDLWAAMASQMSEDFEAEGGQFSD